MLKEKFLQRRLKILGIVDNYSEHELGIQGELVQCPHRSMEFLRRNALVEVHSYKLRKSSAHILVPKL